MVQLGLIGDNIRKSKAPVLHRLAGDLSGVAVTYDLLIPAEKGLGFDDLFAFCADNRFRGINVTYPYKEQVMRHLQIPDAAVRALGACNTVIFGDGQPVGYNTDYTGFRAAFAHGFPGRAPGRVAMAGAGGVGKAIAFALADLGAEALFLFDPSVERAQALAFALGQYAPQMEVVIAPDIASACATATGLVNSTPLGMDGIPGTAFPEGLIAGKDWAFDAIYTPVETLFLTGAARTGLQILSGYELFFYQGVDAFRHFTGREVNQPALRAGLMVAN